jgi:hypothetical protein
LIGKPEKKRLLENVGVDVRIILKLILIKLGGRMWTGFISLRIGTSGGSFERDNAPSSLI